MEYYRAHPVLDTTGCVITIKDIQHKFVSSNADFSAYSTIPAKQLTGLTDQDMPWKRNAGTFIANDINTLYGEDDIIIEEYPYLKKSLLITKKVTVFDNAGLPAGILSLGLPFDGKYLDRFRKRLDQITEPLDRIPKLTKGEYLVLYLLAQGFKRKKIIDSGNISETNYDAYIKRLKKKLQVNTTNELIIKAYKIGADRRLPNNYPYETQKH